MLYVKNLLRVMTMSGFGSMILQVVSRDSAWQTNEKCISDK